ncbi:preprotein translocase subunit YajC [Kocuria rhizophila]|uniref:preprotein translocase subunit YajC n=1 Tax=Kocuria rhizophila TaxID=72000 RepID=UPI0021B239DB|nr:preprotein translocase subunit YajC [Kocuria rhizophila]WTI32805.1 preprotein translocase subunit YajC [Kocuria rhizophila]
MTILAETQQAATGGGTAWFLPVMLVVMVLLLWLPMRRQKKAQAEMKAKQAGMEPGTRVMTSFGLFGTLRDMDRENNKAVLEIAPGQLVTVHSQTVTTVVDETPAGAEPVAEHTDAAGGASTAGSTPAQDTVRPTDAGTAAGEQPEHQTWRDAREPGDRGDTTI